MQDATEKQRLEKQLLTEQQNNVCLVQYACKASLAADVASKKVSAATKNSLLSAVFMSPESMVMKACGYDGVKFFLVADDGPTYAVAFLAPQGVVVDVFRVHLEPADGQITIRVERLPSVGGAPASFRINVTIVSFNATVTSLTIVADMRRSEHSAAPFAGSVQQI